MDYDELQVRMIVSVAWEDVEICQWNDTYYPGIEANGPHMYFMQHEHGNSFILDQIDKILGGIPLSEYRMLISNHNDYGIRVFNPMFRTLSSLCEFINAINKICAGKRDSLDAIKDKSERKELGLA